jgi:hypothetical protein
VIPAMPPIFLPVWLGIGLLFGWIAWKTQTEWWIAVAFVWLVFVGPLCWLMLGAALS